MKIAIIDSGIRTDHPELRPAGGRNCVVHEDESLWYEDEHGHGTHCAGIVAALGSGIGIKGYVPEAEIYSYRVVARDAVGPTTFDSIKAIELAVEDGCDILNMSFGSRTPQTLLRSRTEYAYDKGVLCVAATGNTAEAVMYPAAFPAVTGVGAFGKFDTYPDDSLHKEKESNIHSSDGECYVAAFSNYGGDVDFCAPGVAILSTVPNGYSAWDGTSMACPQVTGIAALALAMNPDILNAPRDADRVERLLQLLKSCAHPLGFGAAYEGAGCLYVEHLAGGIV